MENVTGNLINNLWVNIAVTFNGQTKREIEEIVRRKPKNIEYSRMKFLSHEGNSNQRNDYHSFPATFNFLKFHFNYTKDFSKFIKEKSDFSELIFNILLY